MKTYIAVVLACFVALATCEIDIAPNVVNGVDTSILDHPYMAGIHVNWMGRGFVPFCGASIINRRSVLTAAHCLVFNNTAQASAADVRVSVGSSYRMGTNGVFYDVFRMIRHPQYLLNDDMIQADVAVVRLIWPLVFSRIVQPIPLGKTRVEAGDMVMVTGWGFISSDSTQVATRMQRVLMQAISNARCLWIHRDTIPSWVTREMVCLLAGTGQGVCGGDSGKHKNN
ncbi:hypothetical protein ACKWTF_005425 [Chironomus riparius]